MRMRRHVMASTLVVRRRPGVCRLVRRDHRQKHPEDHRQPERNCCGTTHGAEHDYAAAHVKRGIRVAVPRGQSGPLPRGAQRVLDMTTEYAKIRIAFGKPIFDFQVIKHMLADVLLELEAARSAFLYAAPVLDGGSEEAKVLGHLCQVVASEAYLKATKTAIQVHGAIGFTWEHDLHLYFKRATSGAQVLGNPQFHRERIATALLDT